MMGNQPANTDSILRGLRRLLWVTYLIGAVGIGGELLLMEHTEDAWQWAPIGLVGLSVLAFLAQSFAPRRWLMRLFQAVVVLILVSAFVGMWLHFDGKAEFKLEIDPELKGWDLVWACIHGHSLPPVFAPGSMILLGLIGVAWSYKYPSLYRNEKQLENNR